MLLFVPGLAGPPSQDMLCLVDLGSLRTIVTVTCSCSFLVFYDLMLESGLHLLVTSV